jgi:hypothetical protein
MCPCEKAGEKVETNKRAVMVKMRMMISQMDFEISKQLATFALRSFAVSTAFDPGRFLRHKPGHPPPCQTSIDR